MKTSNKRYYLVETETTDELTPTLARIKRGVEDEYTKVRTADVTDWVTPGGSAAFLRSVVEWTP